MSKTDDDKRMGGPIGSSANYEPGEKIPELRILAPDGTEYTPSTFPASAPPGERPEEGDDDPADTSDLDDEDPIE